MIRSGSVPMLSTVMRRATVVLSRTGSPKVNSDSVKAIAAWALAAATYRDVEVGRQHLRPARAWRVGTMAVPPSTLMFPVQPAGVGVDKRRLSPPVPTVPSSPTHTPLHAVPGSPRPPPAPSPAATSARSRASLSGIRTTNSLQGVNAGTRVYRQPASQAGWTSRTVSRSVRTPPGTACERADRREAQRGRPPRRQPVLKSMMVRGAALLVRRPRREDRARALDGDADPETVARRSAWLGASD